MLFWKSFQRKWSKEKRIHYSSAIVVAFFLLCGKTTCNFMINWKYINSIPVKSMIQVEVTGSKCFLASNIHMRKLCTSKSCLRRSLNWNSCCECTSVESSSKYDLPQRLNALIDSIFPGNRTNGICINFKCNL